MERKHCCNETKIKHLDIELIIFLSIINPKLIPIFVECVSIIILYNYSSMCTGVYIRQPTSNTLFRCFFHLRFLFDQCLQYFRNNTVKCMCTLLCLLSAQELTKVFVHLIQFCSEIKHKYFITFPYTQC